MALGGCLPSQGGTPTASRSVPSLIDSVPTPSPSPRGVEQEKILLGTAFFHEGFEEGMASWSVSPAAQVVSWRRLEGNFCGGAFAMLLGLEGRAAFAEASGDRYLTLDRPVNLTGKSRPHLTFDVLGSANPVDSLLLQPEVRRPGGAWQAVGVLTYAEYPRAVAHRYADLTAFKEGEVELRFKATLTPAAQPGLGLLLDDIKLVEPSNL